MNDRGTFQQEATGSIAITAPARSAWAVLADFHHVDKWAERAQAVEPMGAVSSGLGAGRRVMVKGIGAIEETITHWEENRTVGYMVSPIGPIGRSLSLWTIKEEDSDACVATLQLRYNMRYGPIGAILHVALVRARIASHITPILNAFKYYVETGEKLITES